MTAEKLELSPKQLKDLEAVYEEFGCHGDKFTPFNRQYLLALINEGVDHEHRFFNDPETGPEVMLTAECVICTNRITRPNRTYNPIFLQLQYRDAANWKVEFDIHVPDIFWEQFPYGIREDIPFQRFTIPSMRCIYDLRTYDGDEELDHDLLELMGYNSVQESDHLVITEY